MFGRLQGLLRTPARTFFGCYRRNKNQRYCAQKHGFARHWSKRQLHVAMTDHFTDGYDVEFKE
jgi:hypothetical protein